MTFKIAELSSLSSTILKQREVCLKLCMSFKRDRSTTLRDLLVRDLGFHTYQKETMCSFVEEQAFFPF